MQRPLPTASVHHSPTIAMLRVLALAVAASALNITYYYGNTASSILPYASLPAPHAHRNAAEIMLLLADTGRSTVWKLVEAVALEGETLEPEGIVRLGTVTATEASRVTLVFCLEYMLRRPSCARLAADTVGLFRVSKTSRKDAFHAALQATVEVLAIHTIACFIASQMGGSETWRCWTSSRMSAFASAEFRLGMHTVKRNASEAPADVSAACSADRARRGAPCDLTSSGGAGDRSAHHPPCGMGRRTSGASGSGAPDRTWNIFGRARSVCAPISDQPAEDASKKNRCGCGGRWLALLLVHVNCSMCAVRALYCQP
jgi:hypothetical protein